MKAIIMYRLDGQFKQVTLKYNKDEQVINWVEARKAEGMDIYNIELLDDDCKIVTYGSKIIEHFYPRPAEFAED